MSRRETIAGLIALSLIALTAIGFAVAYAQPETREDNAEAASAASAFSLPATFDPAFQNLSLQAKAAIVVDLKTMQILYARNPHTQLPLASITKVPLALVVSEVLDPNQVITIPQDTAPKGSLERLGKGEQWPVQSILDFTLVASSNDGAEILAAAANDAVHQKYPGSPAGGATLWRMNDLARELGLARTYFLNASGLDVSMTLSGAYSSASDVATLFAYAERTAPSVFARTTRDGIVLTSINGEQTSAINTNEAEAAIPGLVMGKTGFTDLAGGNLAVFFDVGPAHPVVAVVLGSTIGGRFDDMEALVHATREALTH